MPQAKGYSLWLMPSGELYVRLASLITNLSERHHTPNFEPHVTLLGEIVGSARDVFSKTRELSSVVRRCSIELSDVEHADTYFKCLFLRAGETDAVMRANLEARKVFDRGNDTKYMPHLSLLYGNFPPETKEQIIREIGNRIPVSFAVDSIHLFSTNGGPEEWRRMLEFSLQ